MLPGAGPLHSRAQMTSAPHATFPHLPAMGRPAPRLRVARPRRARRRRRAGPRLTGPIFRQGRTRVPCCCGAALSILPLSILRTCLGSGSTWSCVRTMSKSAASRRPSPAWFASGTIYCRSTVEVCKDTCNPMSRTCFAGPGCVPAGRLLLFSAHKLASNCTVWRRVSLACSDPADRCSELQKQNRSLL